MFYRHVLLILLIRCLDVIHAYVNSNGYYSRKNLNFKANRMASTISNNVPNDAELTEVLNRGCVLVSQPDDFSHFYVKSVILVFDYGKEETQGVILERPSAFTVGETAPGIGIFEGNTLFVGGESGNDMAMMFHKYDLNGAAKYIGSGIYLGGLKSAKQLVLDRKAHPKDFKFIFNYSVWPKGVLEKEIAEGRWHLMRCPPDMLIKQEDDSLWSRCRRKLRKLGQLNNSKVEEDSDE